MPEPFGPTTHVMPGSNRSVVADAKLLNPRRVRLLRCTRRSVPGQVGHDPAEPRTRRRVGRGVTWEVTGYHVTTTGDEGEPGEFRGWTGGRGGKVEEHGNPARHNTARTSGNDKGTPKRP
ncbi:hypothetical protein GCM10023205_01940 [Yinghuangia aomiensis]|uniref:Uncharacterized protein n=1 Tax=Yinghuangia aomiensis TaxID=676205 RepID=A0ABP9GN94_9ACTN